MGADFWPVPLPGGGGRGQVWDFGGWLNLYRDNPRWVLAPGPQGAVSTVRFEMLVEGIQECEARLAIEEALASGRLDAPLQEECRDLLAERMAEREPVGSRDWQVGPDWQDRTARLFDLAGRVAR
jgi:hypothetical protein